jgi:hypothetical protein
MTLGDKPLYFPKSHYPFCPLQKNFASFEIGAKYVAIIYLILGIVGFKSISELAVLNGKYFKELFIEHKHSHKTNLYVKTIFKLILM